MSKRLALSLAAALIASILSAPKAFAHGEAGDEPFLKDLTTAFYDVHISPTEIQVGQPVTITGTVRILETWPYTLDPPNRLTSRRWYPARFSLYKIGLSMDNPHRDLFLLRREASTNSRWSC